MISVICPSLSKYNCLIKELVDSLGFTYIVKMHQKCVIWQLSDSFLHGECFLQATQMCHKCIIWQFSDSFLPQMFPGNVSWWSHKSIRYQSELIFLTELWQFYKFGNDSFLTDLWLLILFLDISATFLTDIWHIFASDWFVTDIWHSSDCFLTDLCDWQFSDRFLTDNWLFSGTLGTYIDQEYPNVGLFVGMSCLVSGRLVLRRREVPGEEAAGTDHGHAKPVHLASELGCGFFYRCRLRVFLDGTLRLGRLSLTARRRPVRGRFYNERGGGGVKMRWGCCSRWAGHTGMAWG